MNLTKRDDFVGRQQVTPLVVGAVQTKRIELPACIAAIPEPLGASSARVETRGHDVTDSSRPFALHPKQAGSKIEDQVVPLVVKG